MHAILTTDVANYAVPEDRYSHAQDICLSSGYGLFQLWNDGGELLQSIGSVGDIPPAIWTHTPVPFGMDIITLKQRFEERAASVLGDSTFNLWESRTHTNAYNRYINLTVRAAWMMYVDQAIEHFNSK